ncbi:MAG: carbohydrate-binding protein, partial [Alphaproteobacteria bacterium]|nr:carbohydrate-binding protein [Alphaproteobacteria bacterium]
MASTIYEAENALIVGAEVKSYRPGASNAYVDYANNSGDYIEWTINQEAAGQYDLAFQYALGASNSRPLKLYINGEEQTDLLNFTSTGSWDQWNAITKTLQLNAGENSVRIEAAGSSGPNIDFLQVSDPVSGGEDTTTGGGEDTTAGGGEDTTTGGGEDTTAGGGEDTTSGGGEDTTSGGGGEDTTTGGNAAYDMMFEAEDAVIVGGVVSDYRAGASNAYVDYTNNTGDYIEWTVSLDQAGDYNLAFQYALGASASRPLQLSINGELQTGLVDFSSTGGWDQWQSVVETLALDAGNNVIRLEAAGKSGPNIDFMQVTSVA